MTFETFVVTRANRFAHAVALAVAEEPARIYNPVIVWGPSGAGKSHLLRGIHNTLAEGGEHSVRTMAREELPDALTSDTEHLSDVEVLLFDDLDPGQFIAIEEILVALVEQGVQVVTVVRGDFDDVRALYSWARDHDRALVVDCWPRAAVATP